MIRLHTRFVATMALATIVMSSAPTIAEEWVQLFNGKDLTGWTPKIRGEKLGEDSRQTFRVENGVIKVAYDKYDSFDERFGHLFYDKPFSNYVLRIEYRFVGDQCKGGPGWATRNSGVMLHCQDPKTMTIDQDFPVSLEAQFLGGLGKGPRPTLNLCTPGTHVNYAGKLHTPHCTNSTSETYDGDRWVTAELEVHGDKVIRHKVDGKTVIEYEKPVYDLNDKNVKNLPEAIRNQPTIKGGWISLQAESHPLEFRKVEIRELKD
ncbi:DUF1080 domain-containing protein [bacterium]|nr:DUF1080 domain-containing protein [bacterium]